MEINLLVLRKLKYLILKRPVQCQVKETRKPHNFKKQKKTTKVKSDLESEGW